MHKGKMYIPPDILLGNIEICIAMFLSRLFSSLTIITQISFVSPSVITTDPLTLRLVSIEILALEYVYLNTRYFV